MKKNLLLFVFYLCVLTTGRGQAVGEFVILNSGDTIFGTISNKKFDDEHLLFGKVSITDNAGITQTFTAADIAGFNIHWVRYVSLNINEGKKAKPKMMIFRVKLSGYCTLYERIVMVAHPSSTTFYTGNGNFTSAPMAGEPVRSTEYYLQKGNEPLHQYNYKKLVRGSDLYFIENGPLTYDIKNKKYLEYEVSRIVNRFNRERIEKESASSAR